MFTICIDTIENHLCKRTKITCAALLAVADKYKNNEVIPLNTLVVSIYTISTILLKKN